MRCKRSTSSSGCAPKAVSEEAPYLEAELEDSSTEEMNKTPEENKNPSGKAENSKSSTEKPTERSMSFSPPPALSPAYSLQELTAEEPEKIEVKIEIGSDLEGKNAEKKEERRPKMTYKKRVEKGKEVVPFNDPNAPKRNRSAYVHFIIHRRSAYSKTVLSQREINISLAADWQKLTTEERVPFQQKAEEEKQKYLELMEEYKKTDSHKEFQKKRAKAAALQKGASFSKHRKRPRLESYSDDDENETPQMAFPKTNVFCPLLDPTSSASPSSSNIQYRGPIFTPEFMSYNKTRDSYRRQLAMERANVEHELEALHEHDVEVRIAKQEEQICSVDEKIEETMEKMKGMLGGIPAAKDHLTSIEALTLWLNSVTRMGHSNSTKKSVKDALNMNRKMINGMRKMN